MSAIPSSSRLVYDSSIDQLIPRSNGGKKVYNDRYIPHRESTNTLANQWQLLSGNTSEEQGSHVNTKGNQAYIQMLRRTILQEPLDTPILHYSPASKPIDTLREKKFTPLHINPCLCETYEASGITTDFYTDLIDWSDSAGHETALATSLITEDNTAEAYLAPMKGSKMITVHSICQLPCIWSLKLRKSSEELIVGQNGYVCIYNTESRKETRHVRIANIDGLGGRVGALAAHPNEHVILAGSKDTKISVLDTRERKAVVKIISGHTQEVCNLQWAKTLDCFASGGNDNNFRVWDMRYSLTNHSQQDQFIFGKTIKAAIRAQGFSPVQPKLLANGGGTHDGMLRIWDIAKQRLIAEANTGSQVTKLFWSLDGRYLVTTHGFVSFNIKLWQFDNTTLHYSERTSPL